MNGHFKVGFIESMKNQIYYYYYNFKMDKLQQGLVKMVIILLNKINS